MTPNPNLDPTDSPLQPGDIPEIDDFLDKIRDDPEQMMIEFGIINPEMPPLSTKHIEQDYSAEGNLMLKLGAGNYTEKEALDLLDFLYTWFFGPNHGALVHAQREELELIMGGFGGVIQIIHQIMNSRDLHQKAIHQLESLWEKYLHRPPSQEELYKWLNPIIYDYKNTLRILESNLSNPIEVLTSMKSVFGEGEELSRLPISELRKSLDMLERFVEENYPVRWDFWEFRAILLNLVGNYKEAKSDFEMAIKLNHRESRNRSYDGLLSCLIKLGEEDPQYFKDGLNQFLEYQNLDESSWMITHAIGKLYFLNQDYSLSKQFFIETLGKCKSDTWGVTSIELYNSFNELREPNDALSFFLDLERDLDWGRAYALGHLYQTYKKDLDLAISYFEKSFDLQESKTDFNLNLFSLVDCLLEQKQLRKAEKYSLTAFELFPRNYQPSFQLGKIYFIQKELTKSLKFLRLAATYNPQGADIWYHLGLVILQQDNQNQLENVSYILADEAFQNAKDCEPGEKLLKQIELETKGLKNPDTQLRKLLKEKLSINELREMCFDLAIDVEDIAVGEKSKIVLGLLTYMNNRNLKSEILAWLRENHRLPSLV